MLGTGPAERRGGNFEPVACVDTGSFLEPVLELKEAISMSIFKRCPFYRDSETFAMGRSPGHCDVCGQAICNGDPQFCENPEKLMKELLKQGENEAWKDKGVQNRSKNPSHYKVLVVDDEEPVAKIVVAFLSMQGHECVTASSGVDALRKVQQSKFDAVITDIVMPQMDGIALTKELLTLYPDLPVMIMTGHSKEYPTEAAISAGARDFIEKPFSQEGFILRFNKMMSDHEILLKIEAKQKEMLFHMQRESSERIDELQREVENLKSRLYAGYPGFNR